MLLPILIATVHSSLNKVGIYISACRSVTKCLNTCHRSRAMCLTSLRAVKTHGVVLDTNLLRSLAKFSGDDSSVQPYCTTTPVPKLLTAYSVFFLSEKCTPIIKFLSSQWAHMLFRWSARFAYAIPSDKQSSSFTWFFLRCPSTPTQMLDGYGNQKPGNVTVP